MMYLEEALYCGCFAVDCRAPPGEAIGYCKVGSKERERAANHIELEWLLAERILCSYLFLQGRLWCPFCGWGK